MPTSSGVPAYSYRGERLLSKRQTTTPHRPDSFSTSDRYRPSYTTTKAPSVREKTNQLLNQRPPSDYSFSTDFKSKIDLNNNSSLSSGYSKTDYSRGSTKTSTGAYGSHYQKSVTSPASTVNHYADSSSALNASSRGSSLDSGQNLSTPAYRTSLASQNRNESCSSFDADIPSPSGSGMGNIGLTNLGNTCFMSSVLQCLINTRKLKDYVMSVEMSRDLNRTTSSMKGALMEEYSSLVKKIWEESRSISSIAPRELKSEVTRFAPQFRGYNQQDAQEFLRYFLQGLHEDVNRVKSKPKYIGADEAAEERMLDAEKAREYWGRYINFDNSFIVDLFVGQLKSELICQTCSYRSVTFDPFWDLSLPIPKNRYDVDIKSCMDSFTKEEILDGNERPTCAKCKMHRRCTKTFKIQKFPKILVLHLKRFSGEGYRRKLSTKVNFELKGLNLAKYAVDEERSATYNLYGISNHVGSVYSGHYTAYCKHPYKGRWYSFNDSRVGSISESELVSEEAYVLFYELVE